MRYLIIIWVALFITLSTFADPPHPKIGDALKSAKTRDDILATVEKVKGCGIVEWTEMSSWRGRIFVDWYDPFSGISALYVDAYYFDGNEWHLFLNTRLDNADDLSVEWPVDKDALILRYSSGNGIVAHTESLDKVPKFGNKK